MQPSFAVGTSIEFSAFHSLPIEGPESQLHPHTYRIDIQVNSRQLDENAMVCDLDALSSILKELKDVLDGEDLTRLAPSWLSAVTVEGLAKWIHGHMCQRLESTNIESLTVRVWESESEFGLYEADLTTG